MKKKFSVVEYFGEQDRKGIFHLSLTLLEILSKHMRTQALCLDSFSWMLFSLIEPVAGPPSFWRSSVQVVIT